METERNTFVQSLAKFTFLTNFREMKQKNVESIKALMEIAITEGIPTFFFRLRNSHLFRRKLSARLLVNYIEMYITIRATPCHWLGS